MTGSPHQVRLTARRKTLPCIKGRRSSRARGRHFLGGFRATFRRFDRDRCAAAPGSRRSGLDFSVPNSLRFGAKRTVLQRGSDAGGGVRGTVEAFFDDDSPSSNACRERCTCVRGYRRAMSDEVSCRSFAEFEADFYRTEWERVASRRVRSVQRIAKRFCGDLGGRRTYILNRE